MNPELEHKCTDDCARYCEVCSKKMCMYNSEDEYKKIGDVKLCVDCYSREFGYDSEGRYL